jgi:hypothetical protein
MSKPLIPYLRAEILSSQDSTSNDNDTGYCSELYVASRQSVLTGDRRAPNSHHRRQLPNAVFYCCLRSSVVLHKTAGVRHCIKYELVTCNILADG